MKLTNTRADPPPQFRSDSAEDRYVDGDSASFCYRELGWSDVPLVLCQRFRGTIDHWDPAFLEVLSHERRVIIFDNTGVGFSSGFVPPTIGEMADRALEFIDARGLTGVDLLGWSMGGFIAQSAALKRPGLVRRLVVAGSGPGRMPGMPLPPEKVLQIMAKPNPSEDDSLYLFYPETESAREAGLESFRRLDRRLVESQATVTPEAVRAQLAAVTAFGSGLWDQLSELTLPVLIGNGAHDVVISAFASYAMTQRLPNAKLVLYSDAGHAFLFQHFAAFGRDVVEFLS